VNQDIELYGAVDESFISSLKPFIPASGKTAVTITSKFPSNSVAPHWFDFFLWSRHDAVFAPTVKDPD
jgi:hypothetical protein